MKSKAFLSILVLCSPLSGFSGAWASEPSANAISCSEEGPKQDVYPCDFKGGLYLDLAQGVFAVQATEKVETLNPSEYEWVNSVFTKDEEGAIHATGVVAGKVGIPDENGEGGLCSGDEKTSPYSRPEMLENGKFSINKIREVAYDRAVKACFAAKGALSTDGEHGEIIHAHSQAVGSPTDSGKAKKQKAERCFSSEVQIKCDLSSRAAEMTELYRKFREDFPAHPMANDEELDALR
jgi:hypothetical protein